MNQAPNQGYRGYGYGYGARGYGYGVRGYGYGYGYGVREFKYKQMKFRLQFKFPILASKIDTLGYTLMVWDSTSKAWKAIEERDIYNLIPHYNRKFRIAKDDKSYIVHFLGFENADKPYLVLST